MKNKDKCPHCGKNLSEKVGSKEGSYLDAIERSLKRLKKEMGFGIPHKKWINQ